MMKLGKIKVSVKGGKKIVAILKFHAFYQPVRLMVLQLKIEEENILGKLKN